MTRSNMLIGGLCLGFSLWTVLPALSRHQENRPEPPPTQNTLSPARQINHPPNRAERPRNPASSSPFRSIDGSGNNQSNPDINAAHTPLLRQLSADYADGVAALAGPQRPSAREISNLVNAQTSSQPDLFHASDFLWQWGQFLDHDIDLTDGADPAEPANIPVPASDPFFDPDGTGTVEIAFNRSLYDPASGTDTTNPRQQLNEITGWIDASNVYGSDAERAAALRTNDGTGRLLTSDGNLLPFNTDGLPNAGGPSATLFLAGDVRANEQVGLTALHTLFMREHNRLAQHIALNQPNLTGDQIYQRARRRVGAQIQVITYQEYLPTLLGPDTISSYSGYDPNVDARIGNVFSTAAYRFGHSAVSATLLRLDQSGNAIPAGHLSLREAFFAPQRLIDEGGIAPVLRGLAGQVGQQIDPYVIDELRNFLFGEPGAGGFDLVALNIQRGRDHGLPSYNTMRQAAGLTPVQSFSDISADAENQSRLAAAYDSVDEIDAWVGGLAEDVLPQAHLGETFSVLLKDQFEALRDGDRFWYARTLSPQARRAVERTRLADIIRRNTTIGNEIANDVFHVQ